MHIKRVYTAAVGATLDRRFISRSSKVKHDNLDKRFYQSMIQESGPSVHAPHKVIKSWIKAYKNNLERIKMVENINQPFHQQQSLITRIAKRLTHK